MAVLRDQPYSNGRFSVAIDGLPASEFVEVTLPEFSAEVITTRVGGDPGATEHKVPGRRMFGPLVLRRGFRGSLDLYQWWQQATSEPTGGRRDVVVRLLDESGAIAVAEWRLLRAWPSLYAFSHLEALGEVLLMETVEIACDSVEMS